MFAPLAPLRGEGLGGEGLWSAPKLDSNKKGLSNWGEGESKSQTESERGE